MMVYRRVIRFQGLGMRELVVALAFIAVAGCGRVEGTVYLENGRGQAIRQVGAKVVLVRADFRAAFDRGILEFAARRAPLEAEYKALDSRPEPTTFDEWKATRAEMAERLDQQAAEFEAWATKLIEWAKVDETITGPDGHYELHGHGQDVVALKMTQQSIGDVHFESLYFWANQVVGKQVDLGLAVPLRTLGVAVPLRTLLHEGAK